MAYSDNISTTTTINSNFIQAARLKLTLLLKCWQNTSEVNRRTIYRDLSSLEQTRIPIIQIDGKDIG